MTGLVACRAVAPARAVGRLVLACAFAAGLIDVARPDGPASAPGSQPANLLANGDFDRPDATGALPAGWTTEHPANVRRLDLGGQRGGVVQMTGDKQLMGGYGADLLSEKIPIKPNTCYRCTGVTRSDGPNMKVFVRGYGTVTRRVKGELQTFEDAVYTMRKDIPPTGDWTPFNLDFTIVPFNEFGAHQHRVEYVRIKLWAYWPAGTCWFDNLRFEEVGPLPADAVRHPDAVTHTGVPPRLGPGAETTTAAAFDEEQVWLDAANAFRADEFAKAAELGEQLVARAGHKGMYRVLLARALAALQRWSEAEQQAAWLLGDGGAGANSRPAASQPAPQIDPWQRDWACVVRAEACWHTGRTDEAREWLKRALREGAAPQARTAAEQLSRQIADHED